ncbi:hypothetical protein GCM10022384_70120 [Streptomyces marokkonensis]|uniref:Uncharacterized protein n=1 Tax=Streptomyces marokkonensis TaxID=324855 RepID=A0ABP7SWS1_9ACTN
MAPQPRAPNKYPYSSAAPRPSRTLGNMLWSDPENEPPKELRETQDMLRRLSVFLALAMVLAMIVIGAG